MDMVGHFRWHNLHDIAVELELLAVGFACVYSVAP